MSKTLVPEIRDNSRRYNSCRDKPHDHLSFPLLLLLLLIIL
jgi:hypothetical protein